MRPPLSAASALRPHSSASIDRHKLPSLHSHNTSLPTLYLPSQGQGQGASEAFSLQEVGFFLMGHCSTLITHSYTVFLFKAFFSFSQGTGTLHKWDYKNNKRYCVRALGVGEWPTCFPLQPTVVQPCRADPCTVSPSHVQLGFTDQPNCPAVSNGLYTHTTQIAQVVYTLQRYNVMWLLSSKLWWKVIM